MNINKLTNVATNIISEAQNRESAKIQNVLIESLADTFDPTMVPASLTHELIGGMSLGTKIKEIPLKPNEVSGKRVLDMVANGTKASQIFADVLSGKLQTRQDGFEVLMKLVNKEDAQRSANNFSKCWWG